MMRSGSILWHAEPFGFGPAAAIAELAETMRTDLQRSVYLGQRHTLDLQRPSCYDEIVDCSTVDDLDSWLRQRAAEFDLFVTAMDFALAARAKTAGFKVVIYDALAWYWPEIEKASAAADLYLVQDFVGVKRRLAGLELPPTVIVPPLVERQPYVKPSAGPIVSFGGIANPFWGDGVGDSYVAALSAALCSIEGVTAVGAARYRPLAVEAGLPYETLSPQESRERFAAASVIVATPGLGNIYDSAAVARPFVPLPPVNDSQGRQLALLSAAGYLPSSLEWHELLDIEPLDYCSEQWQLLAKMEGLIGTLLTDRRAQTRLGSLLCEHVEAAAANGESRLRSLLDDYGDHGSQCAADALRSLLDGKQPEAKRVTVALRQDERALLNSYGYRPQGEGWQLERLSETETRAELSLCDELGVAVRAVRLTRPSVTQRVGRSDLDRLTAIGLTHFAHTTRPENLDALLRSGAVVPGEELEGILFGDRLGPHGRVVGQLAGLPDDDRSAVEKLLALTGERAPILLFELEVLLGRPAFLNSGYPNAAQISFTTSDGRLEPSLPLGAKAAVRLQQERLRFDHEVVVDGRLPLEQLAVLIVRPQQQRMAEKLAPAGTHVLTTPPAASYPKLQGFQPYSESSPAIVGQALERPLSDRELYQLLARELPELADQLLRGETTAAEVYALIREPVVGELTAVTARRSPRRPSSRLPSFYER